MNRRRSFSALIAFLFLCVLSVDAAWSAQYDQYDATVLCPEQDWPASRVWSNCIFKWADLPHVFPWYSSRPLGYYHQGVYHWNSMAGYQEEYFSLNYSISFATPLSSIAQFDFRHYTVLDNQVFPGIDGVIKDLVFREGWMTFAPFDESRGTLESVRIQVNMTLGTLLHLSLLDTGTFCNAEGAAWGVTQVMGTVGNNWTNYDVPPEGNGAYALSLGTFTGWKEYTDWEGSFLDILAALNNDAWGGAPSLADAIFALVDTVLYPDNQHYVPPNYNKSWWFADRRDLDFTATLTPEEYYSLVNAADGLRITLGKYDQHILAYEAGDTYDESLYASVLVGNMRVTYDYTPVPEPATLSLLALGGLSMMCRRRK